MRLEAAAHPCRSAPLLILERRMGGHPPSPLSRGCAPCTPADVRAGGEFEPRVETRGMKARINRCAHTLAGAGGDGLDFGVESSGGGLEGAGVAALLLEDDEPHVPAEDAAQGADDARRPEELGGSVGA